MRIQATLPDGRQLTLQDGLLDAARAALDALGAATPVRLAYAAAHLVLRPEYRHSGHSLQRPGAAAEIAAAVDWDASMALRQRLDRLGFGVAEAMDTAQRFAIGWDTAARLITECGRQPLAHGFVAGAGVDHLPRIRGRADLVDGAVHQVRFIQDAGGIPILLPLAWLAQQRCDAAAYVDVYGSILRQVQGPLFVHWLGAMFHPALLDYFPGDSFSRVLALDPGKVRGAKLSLLDAAMELRLRRELLARDQVLLTGDDLHFLRLLRGGDPAEPDADAAPVQRWTWIGGRRVALGDFSHALLGVFDAVAAPASLALRFLAHGATSRYRELMEPCEALGRVLFEPPTQHYKAGLAFLCWLNGEQDNFLLVNREDQARDREHFLRLAILAAAAGVFQDAALARARLQDFLACD
ncbi:MAG: DUF993 family protein [Planctomycetota bacterium]|nr:MAG: DUF993 family protein [Planctomycetota bacterium]